VVGKVVFHNLILGKGFILIRDNLIIAGGMLVLLILFFAAMRQFFRKEKGTPEATSETKESNRQVVDNRSTLEWIQKQQKKEK
jgi:Na+-transporting methylmalonyl-CoA/oxaloacetate decarboxylase gamma subunit